jgi:hypothetical protein
MVSDHEPGGYRANAHQFRYPYPLFALLSTGQRILLFTSSAVLMTGSTMALKWVYGTVNGIESIKKDALRPVKAD